MSHFLILSSTAEAPYLRVAKTPRGPTLTFKILNYSLMADVVRAQLRPRVPTDMFEAPPLVCSSENPFSSVLPMSDVSIIDLCDRLSFQVVMNGLSGHGDHLKLLTIMFQNIFPAININTVSILFFNPSVKRRFFLLILQFQYYSFFRSNCQSVSGCYY